MSNRLAPHIWPSWVPHNLEWPAEDRNGALLGTWNVPGGHANMSPNPLLCTGLQETSLCLFQMGQDGRARCRPKITRSECSRRTILCLTWMFLASCR